MPNILDQKIRIIQELQQQGYCRIVVNEWTDETRQDLVNLLEQVGVENYQFHKIKNELNAYLIVQENVINTVPYKLENASISRRSFLKILPLTLALMVLAFTVLLSGYSNDLMSSIMVILIPLILGALFEYIMIREQQNSILLSKIFKIQPLVLVIVIAFCVVVLKEGIICLIMFLPILLIGLLVGAALIRLICHYLGKPSVKIYSIALLPLILWLLLPDFNRTQYEQTQRSMVIHAPAEKVFHAINNIGQIQSQEVKNSFIFTMGFPKPISGMTEQKDDQLIRTIHWERGIKFKENVTASYPPYLLSWNYQFDPNSFPKGFLDDHLEIGGRYFDLLKADYELEEIDDKTTKLTLTIDYRISTEYNWYSKLWANFILNEFSDVVMNLHKQRLEK
ncbi:hypothetical protein EXE30_11725 [Acinetobacter halotolerans]|uniref:SRPBCC family protein n=1 Tax=Acinetobacter halotolerans TaxID=1752076 RepID=A0A4Q6XGX2_9GAMM|nr:hypothetical protein [Acinetobacter halotolerans]RZF51237.1 hypothetical protein EXE30_11725 [Acinetobacter halotolerans]